MATSFSSPSSSSSSSSSVIFYSFLFLFFINSTPFTIIHFASTDPSVSPSSSSFFVADSQRITFPSYVSVENGNVYTLVEELNFMGGQLSRVANRCLRSSKSLSPIRLHTTERVLRSFTNVLEDWKGILEKHQEVQDLLQDSSSSSATIMDDTVLSYSQSAYLSVKKVLESSRNVENQLSSLENIEFPSIDVLDDVQIGLRDLGLSMDRLRFVVFVEKEEEEEEEGGGGEKERQTETVEEDNDDIHHVDVSAEGFELSQFVWEGMSSWVRSSDFVFDDEEASRKKEVEIMAEKLCEMVDAGLFSGHAINSKGRGLSSVRGVRSMMKDVVNSGEELHRSLMYLHKDEDDDVLTAEELRNALKSAEIFLENVFLFRDYVESSFHDERINLWRRRRSSSSSNDNDDDVIVQIEKKHQDKILVASASLRSHWKEQIHMTKAVEALNRIGESALEIEKQLEKIFMNDDERRLIRNEMFDGFSGISVLEELEKNIQNLGVRMKTFVLESPWLLNEYDDSISIDIVESQNGEEQPTLGREEEEEEEERGGEAMMMTKETVGRLNKIANAFNDFELTERKGNRKNSEGNDDIPSSSVTTIVKGNVVRPPFYDLTSQFDLTRELQYSSSVQQLKQQTTEFPLGVRTSTKERFLSLREEV